MKTNCVSMTTPATTVTMIPTGEGRKPYHVFCGNQMCETGHLFDEIMLVMPGDKPKDDFIALNGVYLASVEVPDPEREYYTKSVRPTLWAKPSKAFETYWDEYSKGLYGGTSAAPAWFDVTGYNDGSVFVSAIPQGEIPSARLCCELQPKELGSYFRALGVEYGHPVLLARYEGDWDAYIRDNK